MPGPAWHLGVQLCAHVLVFPLAEELDLVLQQSISRNARSQPQRGGGSLLQYKIELFCQ